MFTLPPRTGNDAGNQSGDRGRPTYNQERFDRSRTPQGSDKPDGLPPWSTGSSQADDWVTRRRIDESVLDAFSQLPQRERRKIVVNSMERNPENADAWLNACIRNWKQKEIEKRVLYSANVHGAPVSKDRLAETPYATRLSHRPQAARHEAAETARPQLASFLLSGSKPADVARDMTKMWPSDKSGMIGKIIEILPADSLDSFLGLSAEDQGAISFTFMVIASEGESKEQYAKYISQWIERLQMLRGEPGAPLSSRSSVHESTTEVNVQFVLAGMPAVMAGMIMSVMMTAIPSMHSDCKWQFALPIFVNIGHFENIDMMDICDAYGVQFSDRITTLQQFTENVDALLHPEGKPKPKFIFVNNIGFAATPELNVQDLEQDHLHLTDSKWIWDMMHIADNIRGQSDDMSVAEIMLAPNTNTFDQQLSSVWGEQNTVGISKKSKVPIPVFKVFSTPAGFTAIPAVGTEADKLDSIEGWGPPDVSAWWQKYPEGVLSPSYISKLMIVKLFKERQLKRSETDILQSVTIKKEDGGQASMNRNWWMRWYGFHNTPAEQVFEKCMPCGQHIIATTGSPVDKASKHSTPCGYLRYCKNCEQVFGVMDKSYATYTTCDVLLAFFTKIATSWRGGDGSDRANWVRKEGLHRKHQCAPNCSGVLD